jgi:crotonobetainyl-CoA hydratase
MERRDHVMIVTINRPEARNAINRAVWLGGGRALKDAAQDADIRVVIVTGAGALSFCAGADLKAIARSESIFPDEPEAQAWGFAGLVRHAIGKPLIAAVNGTALGGGTEIALACDLFVAAETARFGLPEVKRGILAGAGGAFRLGQQVPLKIAMEMLLTGDPIGAQRALKLGLINAVVKPAELLDQARALAAKIARRRIGPRRRRAPPCRGRMCRARCRHARRRISGSVMAWWRRWTCIRFTRMPAAPRKASRSPRRNGKAWKSGRAFPSWPMQIRAPGSIGRSPPK